MFSLYLIDHHTNFCDTGCILIPGYLTIKQQLSFLYDSLAQYTLPPNPLSLSTHYDLPPELFSLFVSDPEATILPKHMTGAVNPEVLTSASQPKSRKLNDTEPASVIGYEEIIARNKAWTGDVPSDKLGAKEVRKLWKEIRWANLGWVYQVSLISVISSHCNFCSPSFDKLVVDKIV